MNLVLTLLSIRLTCCTGNSDEMVDLDLPPLLPQVFSNQAAVAVMRLMLAAKKAPMVEHLAVELVFDATV